MTKIINQSKKVIRITGSHPAGLMLQMSLASATVDNGIVLTAEKAIYSTQDHDTPTYIRNPNRVAPAINLTALSPWNSSLGNKKAGTAITPRNYVLAKHYHIPVDATIRFVELDGTVHDRTVVHTEQVNYDLQIGRLDEDLPAAITPASIPPANLADYFLMEGFYVVEATVAFYTDQEEKLLIGCLNWITNANIDINESANYAAFWETPISGDSGSPVFIVVNGTVVILFTFFSGSGTGTCVHGNRQAILDYCAVTGHEPETIDLSEFPYRS